MFKLINVQQLTVDGVTGVNGRSPLRSTEHSSTCRGPDFVTVLSHNTKANFVLETALKPRESTCQDHVSFNLFEQIGNKQNLILKINTI